MAFVFPLDDGPSASPLNASDGITLFLGCGSLTLKPSFIVARFPFLVFYIFYAAATRVRAEIDIRVAIVYFDFFCLAATRPASA
jgi:hypothetical protein